MTDIETDMESRDYFNDQALFVDPYPYYDHIRAKCPVQREPFHDVVMVTGYDEALRSIRIRRSGPIATRWPAQGSRYRSRVTTSAT